MVAMLLGIAITLGSLVTLVLPMVFLIPMEIMFIPCRCGRRSNHFSLLSILKAAASLALAFVLMLREPANSKLPDVEAERLLA